MGDVATSAVHYDDVKLSDPKDQVRFLVDHLGTAAVMELSHAPTRGLVAKWGSRSNAAMPDDDQIDRIECAVRAYVALAIHEQSHNQARQHFERAVFCKNTVTLTNAIASDRHDIVRGYVDGVVDGA